jgi:histone H3/H4
MSSREQSLVTYLERIFHQVWPDNKWSKDAKQYMNLLVMQVANAIIVEAVNLAEAEGKKTIMLKEMQLAFRIVIHGEVATRAVEFARRSVGQFEQSKPQRGEGRRGKRSPRGAQSPRRERARSPQSAQRVRSPPVRKNERAGIQMSVPRINAMIREQTQFRVQEEVAVYLAAALEEVCRQIFEVAGAKTAAVRRKTVTAAFIEETLKSDLVCLF